MERLYECIQPFGIDQWGACRFSELPPLLDVRSKAWIPPNAKSVLLFLFGYYTEAFPNRNISRYAVPDDYHSILRPLLAEIAASCARRFPEEGFLPFIDSSPIDEVAAAAHAGLGEIGMNGLLLNPVYGSYCFIGEIVTTLPLEIPPPEPLYLCTRCGACRAACPTGALAQDRFVRERCRSEITQKKGELTLWEQEQIRKGGFVWGCDRCTEACPVNRNAEKSRVAGFYRNPVPVVDTQNAASLCKTKAYGWRGKNILLRNLHILSGETEDVVS